MVVRDLLTRGLLAGLLAGVCALGVAKVLGEPQVSRAIAFESQLRQQDHQPPAPALVSRDVQSTVGLATGTLVIGAAFGGLFALAFAFAYGRIGGAGPRVTALLVGGAGFGAMYVLPFLKYPANPPSIGQASTIGYRTELYFAMLAISVLATIAAIIAGRHLLPLFGAWNAALVTVVAFVAFIAAVYVLLPGVNEVPASFPATTLWRFRVASFATQLALWASLSLIFGALVERRLGRPSRRKVDAFG